MKPALGPRDEGRFRALAPDLRDEYAFRLDLGLGILVRRPQHREALGMTADALTALGYFRDGLALDRRLAGLEPEDPVVRYNLACSLSLTGELEEAIACLAEAIRLGYREAEHMLNDRDLEALHGLPAFRALVGQVRSAD